MIGSFKQFLSESQSLGTMTVYHGSGHVITNFDRAKGNQRTLDTRLGVHFAKAKGIAEVFADHSKYLYTVEIPSGGWSRVPNLPAGDAFSITYYVYQFIERRDQKLWIRISEELADYAWGPNYAKGKITCDRLRREADYVFDYMFDEDSRFVDEICDRFISLHGGTGLIYKNTWETEVNSNDPTCYILFDPSKAKILEMKRVHG